MKTNFSDSTQHSAGSSDRFPGPGSGLQEPVRSRTAGAGCTAGSARAARHSRHPLPREDDQQIGSDIQAKIGAESALNGQNIQVSVANGVATLEGKVDNDASRALAAADSASIDGVRTVVNNLVVAPAKVAKAVPEPRRRKEVAQAAPPPPPPAPAGSSSPGADASRSSTAPTASAAPCGQDGDSPCRDGDSDSHDGYAG